MVELLRFELRNLSVGHFECLAFANFAIVPYALRNDGRRRSAMSVTQRRCWCGVLVATQLVRQGTDSPHIPAFKVSRKDLKDVSKWTKRVVGDGRFGLPYAGVKVLCLHHLANPHHFLPCKRIKIISSFAKGFCVERSGYLLSTIIL